MISLIESFITERLKRLISYKRKYLLKQQNSTAVRYLQEEILFLERDILPAVEVGTQLVNYECVRYFNRTLDISINHGCDGMLVYIPLKNDYNDKPKVAIFNPRELSDKPCSLVIEIIAMDDNVKQIEPINLHLNALV